MLGDIHLSTEHTIEDTAKVISGNLSSLVLLYEYVICFIVGFSMGPNIVLSKGLSQCVVCGGRHNISTSLSLAISMTFRDM